MAVKSKPVGTIAAVIIIVAAIYGVGLFDPSKKTDEKKDDAVKVTLHASTTEGRKKSDVIIVVLVNGVQQGNSESMTGQTWGPKILVLPKGTSVAIGVWQLTPGTVTCAIRKDNNVVSNDITSKVVNTGTTILSELIDQSAKCYYKNTG